MRVGQFSRARRRRRSGAALTEMAICLPVIVLIVFASIEACTMIFVKQGLSAAAYEAIRVAVQKDGTAATAQTAAERITTARKLNGVTFVFNPTDVTTVTSGSPIQVTVSAPATGNGLLPLRYFGGKTLAGSASMVKE